MYDIWLKIKVYKELGLNSVLAILEEVVQIQITILKHQIACNFIEKEVLPQLFFIVKLTKVSRTPYLYNISG